MVKIKTSTRLSKVEPIAQAKPAPNGRYSDTGSFAASDSDIIDDLLARVIALAPDFSAALAESIDKETRAKWGGDRVYISIKRGGGKSSRNQEIKHLHQMGAHVAYLQRHFDLSNSRIWEIIKD